jgi:vacuolar-type H+-ATPase subunit I/STV1
MGVREMTQNNLEYTLNKLGFDIVNERILDENDINKFLGVLSNDGVYAMWIYAQDKLKVKFDENKNSLNEEKIFKLLAKVEEIDKYIMKSLNYKDIIEKISNLTKEIKQLEDKIKNKSSSQEEKKQLENLKKMREKERDKELNKYFLNLSSNLNDLLFFKELFEKVLIYARYHAKAMGE